MNDLITTTVAQLGLNIAANAIWDVTRQYFSSTKNPTEEGMIQIWADK